MKIIISFFGVLGFVFVFYQVSQTSELSSLENNLLNILLAISAMTLSWTMSEYYSRKSNKKDNVALIDGIGERASEKLLNQSRILWKIERYIENETSNIPNKENVFLNSVIEMIKLVRSSNNTYLSDWHGLTSKSVTEKILLQTKAQSELFEDMELIVKEGEESIDPNLKERILKNYNKLPSYLTPATNYSLITKTISIESIEYSANDKETSKGFLSVLLHKDVYHFAAGGKIDPPMDKVPNKLYATLISKPSGIQKYLINCSTGTIFDFQIHIKSPEANIKLPKGKYKFQFTIEKESQDQDTESVLENKKLVL